METPREKEVGALSDALIYKTKRELSFTAYLLDIEILWNLVKIYETKNISVALDTLAMANFHVKYKF